MTSWTRRRFLGLRLTQGVMVAACTPSQPAPAAAPPKPTEAAKPTTPASTAPTAAPAAAAKPSAEAKPAADAKLTAAAAAAAPAKPGGKNEIVVVQSADIANIDPSRAALVHVFNLGHSVLDTLAYLDRSMKLQPRLALSWASIDEKTWDVKLRTGVKFHDGTPFDATAVKQSFDYQAGPDAASKTFFINWESAEGLAERSVMLRDALKPSLIPFVTVVGLELGSLLGGLVVVEQIFAWPGIGWLTIQAITQRDYAMVQGGVMLVAVGVVTVNFLVDLLYAYLDPRIRYR